ncbi:stage II sporulation protein P [Niallia sp. HCP3S3_B10]|uniref:stage II sporulation protein P n=1 Tax=Niallia sp. HCP3S3_B10 TaxID=3438944 RepID=UPI003F89686D
MQKSKTRSIINYLNTTVLAVIMLFVIVALITTSYFSFKFSSTNLTNLFKSVNSTEFYVDMMHSENHLFPKSEGRDSSLSNIFLHLTTNIRFDDIRTLLGRELPALTYFHTEIAVAEEGTTLANLPFESIPSQDMLENPLKVDEEKAKQEENSQTQPPPSEEHKNPVTEPNNKTVFIYNSHNLEAYRPLLENTTNNENVVSSDERANVVGVSSKLTNLLQQEGLGVEFSKANINQILLDKKWNYYSAYKASKEVVEAAVSKNNSLKYLIDIHRDAAGKQITTASINGKNYAKLYLVVGKGNTNYEKNLAFSIRLHDELKKNYPGISRGVFLKGYDEGDGVYNQNFSDRAILLEVGGVDNTNDEITRSIEAFAEIFSKLYWEENNATQQ